MLEQFSEESLWHGGPLLELTMIFEPDCDLNMIEDFFRTSEKIQLYKSDSFNSRDRFLFEFAAEKFIGLEFGHYLSTHQVEQAYFILCFRPRQLNKLLDADFDFVSDSELNLDISQKISLSLLTKALIRFLPMVQRLAKLRYATIALEVDGCANLRTKLPDGLYFNKIFANELNLIGQKSSHYLTLVASNFEQLDELMAKMPN
ncbi:MAG: hypothetical protein SFY67_08705 [Candidatus Melainabacteria bacterium]|nr:hypothetical protein [Candidatus Melainabacteria bacterium]